MRTLFIIPLVLMALLPPANASSERHYCAVLGVASIEGDDVTSIEKAGFEILFQRDGNSLVFSSDSWYFEGSKYTLDDAGDGSFDMANIAETMRFASPYLSYVSSSVIRTVAFHAKCKKL